MGRPASTMPMTIHTRTGRAKTNSPALLPRRSAHSRTGSRSTDRIRVPIISVELDIVTEHDPVAVFGLHHVIDLDVDGAEIAGVAAGIVGLGRFGHEGLRPLGDLHVPLPAAQIVRLLAAIHDRDIERPPRRPERRRVAALGSAVAIDAGAPFLLGDSGPAR